MRRFFDGLAILAITVLGPAGLCADDRQIAQEIVKALQTQEQYGTLTDFSIDLQVKNGEVQLKGRVASEADEQLAVEIVQQVDGVELVYNDLEITPTSVDRTRTAKPASSLSRLQDGLMQKITRTASSSPSEVQLASHRSDGQADSRAIAEDIISQLRAEMKRGNLKGFGVDVAVDAGVVTLQGRVATEQQRRLALDIARSTRGVKRVLDELDVTGSGGDLRGLQPPTPPRELASADSASNELAQAVVARLRQQKSKGNLKDFSIDVNVSDGVVWLSGVVADKEQMSLALDQARYVRGVKAVVNDLKVGSSSELAMTALTQPAAPALLGQNSPGSSQMPVPFARTQAANFVPPGACSTCPPGGIGGGIGGGTPLPMAAAGMGMGGGMYDHPQMPGYAWPSYAPYPNYGAVTYPRQYSAQAWPYIGPFYPYPQVPLGWRKVTLEWDDGWWMLDFKSR